MTIIDMKTKEVIESEEAEKAYLLYQKLSPFLRKIPCKSNPYTTNSYSFIPINLNLHYKREKLQELTNNTGKGHLFTLYKKEKERSANKSFLSKLLTGFGWTKIQRKEPETLSVIPYEIYKIKKAAGNSPLLIMWRPDDKENKIPTFQEFIQVFLNE